MSGSYDPHAYVGFMEYALQGDTPRKYDKYVFVSPYSRTTVFLGQSHGNA